MAYSNTSNIKRSKEYYSEIETKEVYYGLNAINKDTLNKSVIRILDFTISISAIIFLLPVFLIVSILVFLQDGGTVFYGQERIGYNGVKFKCLKFRSMLKNSQEILVDLLEKDPVARAEWSRDHKLKNDPRITKLGRFLRKTSIDELPQLFNVLKGEMSLVGPRPIVQDEVSKYGSSFRFYVSNVPGITGLWQISGRNDIDYNRRVALDRAYTNKSSIGLYFKILFLTIPSVLKQRGSY